MSKKILVIDDSMPHHKLISSYLKPDKLEIRSAYDGESGLALAATLQPNLILLDVDMPGMEGFEVCRRLKSNPATAAIPIIFLTALSTLDNRVNGLDIGAADYISKPFKPLELRARVRASLRAKSQIEAMNLVDAPTGLWNRAYLNAHIEYHVALAKRLDIALSCMVVAVDYPDTLTETFGGTIIPDLFHSVGRILSGKCRVEDVVCRFDARKFAILLSGANGAAAVRVADRLRREVERQLGIKYGRRTQITCSFGIADTIFGDASTLIERADAALCQTHAVGFNHVRLARAAQSVLIAVA
jgi:diguanylate cyclase (GGDEF)-like protein